MNSIRLPRIALYALSLAFVLATLTVLEKFGLAAAFTSVYAPIAFIILAALDCRRTLVLRGGNEEVVAYANAGSYRPGVYVDEYGFVRVAPIGTNIAIESATAAPAAAGPCLTDRLLGYLFVAPFVFPARLYELITTK